MLLVDFYIASTFSFVECTPSVMMQRPNIHAGAILTSQVDGNVKFSCYIILQILRSEMLNTISILKVYLCLVIQ